MNWTERMGFRVQTSLQVWDQQDENEKQLEKSGDPGGGYYDRWFIFVWLHFCWCKVLVAILKHLGGQAGSLSALKTLQLETRKTAKSNK